MRLRGSSTPLRFRLPTGSLNARTIICAAPIIVAISAFYLFLASSGTFQDLPTQSDYYDRMAEGFRAGHLYIVEAPPPALLAKEDPFRFANRPLWLWDASLYNGRYYLYWGPAPALLLLAYKVVVGTHERITDQWPTALFMIGRLWAGAALILSLVSRPKLRQPTWLSCLAIAVFGLGNPTPFIVARPHVYEAALAGGQCFLFWGLVAAFWGIEVARRRALLFTAAGIAWGLAIACRVTNFMSVPAVVAVTAAFAWYNSSRAWRPWVRDCVALSLPIVAVSVAYGLYNYARFGAPTEFGVTYQLSTMPFWGNNAYIIPNILSYLFAPIEVSCRFPFFWMSTDLKLSSLIRWPSGYQTFELIGGIMLTTAWCWLAPLLVARVAVHLHASYRAPRSSDGASWIRSHESWLVLTALGTMVAMIPALPFWQASMRYVEDALGGMLLLSNCCAFWLVRRSTAGRSHIARWLSRIIVVFLALQSVVVGSLVAFRSYYDPFIAQNPALYQKLELDLSVCRKGHPDAPP